MNSPPDQPTILCLSQQSFDRQFARDAAQVCQAELVLADSPAHAAALLSQRTVLALLADGTTESQYQALESAIQETVGIFSEKIRPNSFHYFTHHSLHSSPWLVASPIFGQWIQRRPEYAPEWGKHYARAINLGRQDKPSGLASFFGSEVRVQKVELGRSTEKVDAVEAAKEFILQANFPSRAAAVMAGAIDELLMNAIFDAPVDALGKPLHVSTSRTLDFELPKDHRVELEIAFDGRYFAALARDTFGSVDRTRFLKHLSLKYTNEEYHVKNHRAGAGIGLSSVVSSGASLIALCEPHTRTEFAVLYERTDNFKAFRDQFRFISVLFYGI